MLATLAPVLFALSALSVDPAAHSVTFTAKAAEVPPGTALEFFLVGPDSDRAYEASFITESRIADIVKAFDRAGIPRGHAVGLAECRFWPAGKAVTIEPDIWQYVRDARNEPHLPIVYTGGRRESDGSPFAETNMPSALFSFYSLDQSAMLFDDNLDQSVAYGRFVSTGKPKPGERVTFTVKWDGKSGSESRELKLEPGRVKEAIESLRGAKTDLDVTPVFSEAMPVAEAVAASKAMASLDSRRIKFNGFRTGQFFYGGFTPDPKWRDRVQRLVQPLEVRLSATNEVFTVIDEDWKVEGDDPKLTPHDEPITALSDKFNGDTCFFYVAADEKLSRIYALMKKLPRRIRNWYVYVD